MYNVVFRTILDGTHKGVITRSSFKNKEKFDEWYDEKMKSWYEIVEEGVSDERGDKLCSSPEARDAAVNAEMNKISEGLKEASRLLVESVFGSNSR